MPWIGHGARIITSHGAHRTTLPLLALKAATEWRLVSLGTIFLFMASASGLALPALVGEVRCP